MYTLLKKESPWKWRAQCEEAVVKSKRFLIQSETVVPYDATKPLKLACDTYPFAVVAIVSHALEEKPIGITYAENNYAKIEKEVEQSS